MQNQNDITVIFDNGGGITLQIVNATGQDYQHTYDDAEQCFADIACALTGADPMIDWEGNDLDDEEINLLNPSDDAIRNGGYRVITVVTADDLSVPDDCSWGNQQRLSDAAKK